MNDANGSPGDLALGSSLPILAKTPLLEISNSRQHRVMFFAKRKAHTRVTRHFIRGFEENGHLVKWINTRKLTRFLGAHLSKQVLRWQVNTFKPDTLLLYHQDGPEDLFDWVPDSIKKVVFYEDGPPGKPPDPRVMAFALKSDAVFTTARGYVPAFRDAGVPQAYYLRTGCDLTDHHPVSARAEFESDIAFIGGARGKDRVDLLKRVQARYALTYYGPGWEKAMGVTPRMEEVYPENYRAICSSAKILIGIDTRDDLDLYFSNRTWLSLACGAFLLTRYVPNLEEHFTNHEHLVWFKSPEECLEMIEYYLPREELRRQIANQASNYVREYHTFRHATAEMLATLFPNP